MSCLLISSFSFCPFPLLLPAHFLFSCLLISSFPACLFPLFLPAYFLFSCLLINSFPAYSFTLFPPTHSFFPARSFPLFLPAALILSCFPITFLSLALLIHSTTSTTDFPFCLYVRFCFLFFASRHCVPAKWVGLRALAFRCRLPAIT